MARRVTARVDISVVLLHTDNEYEVEFCFTDMPNSPSSRCILSLLETRFLYPRITDVALHKAHLFTAIFTHDGERK